MYSDPTASVLNYLDIWWSKLPYHTCQSRVVLLYLPPFLLSLLLDICESVAMHVDMFCVYYLVVIILSLLSISHKPVSLPVTPVQTRADILHWHPLPKHGNLPLTQGVGFTRPMYEQSWGLPDKNCRLVRGWSITVDLFTSRDLLDFSHPFLSHAPVMTASLQIFADTNQN